MESHMRAIGDRIRAKKGSNPPGLLTRLIGQEGVIIHVSPCFSPRLAAVRFDGGTELALYADEMEDVE